MISKRAVTKLQAIILLAIAVIIASGGLYYYVTLTKPPRREILVGSPNPLTGSASKHGIEMRNAISLAAEEW
ncbi:MAG: hypothetical protein QXN33_02940, partial [Candidatus Bathyarchaeia archaeon]